MAGPWLRGLVLAIGLTSAPASPSVAQQSAPEGNPDPRALPAAATLAEVPTSTADHSQFDELAGPFESAEAVNQACLSCHNTGPEQLHGTIHFTWTWPPASPGGDGAGEAAAHGMRHVSNAFLLSTPSNLDACTSCHIGGTRFDDPAMFDPSGEPVAPVDCLSCHEPTGQWTIANFHEDGAACSMCHDERLRGDTPEVEDFAAAARSAGPSTRASCGACHFDADGGQGVKHGDLNADLVDPPATLDVHMAAAPDGAGFTCSTCHTTTDHLIAGSRYTGGPGQSPARPALAGAAASCQGCHTGEPHDQLASGARLDRHIDRVACETCHIPEIARGETATRILWDWSTVGELGRDRQPMVRKDKNDRITYSTEKGDLRTAGEFRPTLIWSNGGLSLRRPGDVLPAPRTAIAEADGARGERWGDGLDSIVADFAGTPWIASYTGDASDAEARIAPVKVMHSVIPVDAEDNSLLAVMFSGRSGDALWNRFDWENAAEAGMEAAGLPFSGEVGFAGVRQMIPVNHMVAPADRATGCESCHTTDGLLAGLPGGFVPGRDRIVLLDWAGLALVAATLAVVLLHGLLRFGFGLFIGRRRHG